MAEYRNQIVRLADLTTTTNTVEGVTFDNCQIVGPAVVFMDGCTLTGSSVQGTFDEVIWEVADERHSIVGAIALRSCTIVNCALREIGFALKSSQVADFVAGMSG